jgi:hypothetical protein
MKKKKGRHPLSLQKTKLKNWKMKKKKDTLFPYRKQNSKIGK